MFWGTLTLATVGALQWLAAGLVNPLWYRDLPLALDVGGLASGAVLYGIGGAFIGFLTTRSESAGVGSLIGAACFAILVTIGPLFTVPAGGVLLTLVLIIPAFVLGLFICGGLRLMLNGPHRRGYMAWLVAVAIGLAGGYWARMSDDEVKAIGIVQRELAALAARPDDAGHPPEFNQAPHVLSHAHLPYSVSAQSVSDQPPTTEVQVAFDDGYTLTCYVINTTPTCSEYGTTDLSGPASDE